MKVIQTETKKHAIKTFVAQNADDEARILVEILRKETSLKPRTEEEVTAAADRAFTREDKEYIEIKDEMVAQLPEKLRQKTFQLKMRYENTLGREMWKNIRKQKLAELAAGDVPVTEKDLPFLKELAKVAQDVEEENVAYGGGWELAREIYKVFPVTNV